MSAFLISDQNSNSLLMFPLSANGNQKPSAIYAGPATKLSSPAGMYIDYTGQRLWVANFTSNAITSYQWPASGSNIKPVAIISGQNTGLSGPLGVCDLTVRAERYG